MEMSWRRLVFRSQNAWRRLSMCQALFIIILIWEAAVLISNRGHSGSFVRSNNGYLSASVNASLINKKAAQRMLHPPKIPPLSSGYWEALHLTRMLPLGPRDHWRLFPTSLGPAFVYSAYYDGRGKVPMVRLIGAAPLRIRSRPLSCLLHYPDRNAVVVASRHKPIHEHWGLPYAAYFFMCEIPKSVGAIPGFVSIVDPIKSELFKDITPISANVIVKSSEFGRQRPPLLVSKRTLKNISEVVSQRTFKNITSSLPSIKEPIRISAINNASYISSEGNKNIYRPLPFPLLAVQHPQQYQNNSFKGEFIVCVKPLHYHYNRAIWIVEFIEMYRLLGASHFIFYNHSIGADVEKVLKHYINIDIVTLLPWNLVLKSQKQIRTEGLFSSLNDCSYRAQYRYQYAVMVDLDEYIIPRKHNNYSSLIKDLLSKPPSPQNIGTRLKVKKKQTELVKYKFSSFIFRNCFFYLYWDNDTEPVTDAVLQNNGESILTKENTHLPYLLTQMKTRRVKTPHKSGVRSKFIVVPTDAVEVGNHIVWESVAGKIPFLVGPEMALSHHYRICEYGGFDCLRQPSIVDRTAHRYLTRLVKRVDSSCRTIFVNEEQCPSAPPLGSPW